jgi:hypothetical protein
MRQQLNEKVMTNHQFGGYGEATIIKKTMDNRNHVKSTEP